MFRLDGMLMIGSAESKVGKTELACKLLRNFSKNHNITGIKVTTIKDRDGWNDHGGEGCGVYSSLEGPYQINEEFNRNSGKDTARLLAAGASRVFWLRVLKEHIPAGMTAILDIIGKDAISICESNSLREIVEPGLFLMTKNSGSESWKNTARWVKKYADMVVSSDGISFDFDLNRIKLINGKWTIRTDATAIILAGGESCRMGIDKSMMSINGRSMIETVCKQLSGSFEQIIISTRDADKFAHLGFEVVTDKIAGQGPLMGIASSLEASSNELNFAVACDIPEIKLYYVNQMLTEAIKSRADIVTLKTRKDKYEPLFTVYRKSALEVINKTLSSGNRKITDLFNLCKVGYIEPDDTDWLLNLNTFTEYEQYQKKHGDEIR